MKKLQSFTATEGYISPEAKEIRMQFNGVLCSSIDGIPNITDVEDESDDWS